MSRNHNAGQARGTPCQYSSFQNPRYIFLSMNRMSTRRQHVLCLSHHRRAPHFSIAQLQPSRSGIHDDSPCHMRICSCDGQVQVSSNSQQSLHQYSKRHDILAIALRVDSPCLGRPARTVSRSLRLLPSQHAALTRCQSTECVWYMHSSRGNVR